MNIRLSKTKLAMLTNVIKTKKKLRKHHMGFILTRGQDIHDNGLAVGWFHNYWGFCHLLPLLPTN